MKETILIKNGELALKGLNRRSFEDILIKNMRHRLSDLGKFKFTSAQSTIMVESEDESVDFDEAVRRLTKVFGIASPSLGTNIKASALAVCTPSIANLISV